MSIENENGTGSGLIIKRVAGQRIMIGGDIIVTVTEVIGRHVRLAIQAPRNIRVDREEVAADIRRHGMRPAVD